MRKFALLAVTALAVGLTVAGVSIAGHTVTADGHHTWMNGWDPKNKPTCPGDYVRVGSLANGLYYDNDGRPAIVISNFDGTSFDWALTDAVKWDIHDVATVMVKGGPSDIEVYHYDAASGGWDDSDEGVTGPPNAKSGGWYGASNALFCFDPKGDPR